MKRQRNLGIGDRIFAGFALVLVLFAVAVGLTRYFFTESGRLQRELSDQILPLREAAHELEQRLLDIGLSARNYVLLPGQRSREAHRSFTAQLQRRLERILADTVAARRPLIREVEAASLEYLHIADSVVASPGVFNQRVNEDLLAHRERAILLARRYAEVQANDATRVLGELRVTRERIELALLLMFVIGLAAAALVTIATIRSIRRPTRDLLHIARSLERGDWQPAREWAEVESTLYANARDPRNELLQIAHAFGSAGIALEARDKQLRSTASISAATASSLDGKAICTSVLRDLCDHSGAEVGVVYVRTQAGSDEYVPVATRALPTSVPPVHKGEGVPGEAIASGKSVLLHDIPDDSAFHLKLGVDELPPRTIAAIPCLFHGEPLGVVVVASLRDLTCDDLKFLESTAGQLAVGLHNVQAYETVQQLLSEVDAQREQIRDQLERLQAQHEELQAQNEEIQAQHEEIQAQSEEIQAQNDELQRQTATLRTADEHKDSFLGLLAHELRNPMSAISNSLYVLANSGDDSTAVSHARRIIERQTQQLTRLVDDLLDVTRIAQGKIRIERKAIDFAAVVRDCIADHSTMAAASGITVDMVLPESPMPVYGDRTRLAQVVGNLLDNAIKFSDRDGRVYIWVTADTNRNEAVLSVRDEGIGIDPSMQPRLFKPFTQADPSRTRSRGGLGLGLSLVKAYLTLHQGDVVVRSDGVGCGCEFIVRLPLMPSSIVDSDDASFVDTDERPVPRRVLLVEDDHDGAASLAEALRLEGHEVLTAESAENAMHVATSAPPDIVICDIGLPGADGFEFAKRLRANEELSSTFLVALSGYASDEDKRRARDAGFDRHLTKPASMQLLRECVQQAATTSS